MTTKIRVGVLRGGPSSEYDVSLKTGASVLKNLPNKYEPEDIFISKEGEWHIDGASHSPEGAFKKVDVVFNALHGEYGEDGQVQKILEYFQVPFTGSKSLASAITMNKVLSKRIYAAYGIPTPDYKTLEKNDFSRDTLTQIFEHGPHPSVIKPIGAGSSVGVSIVKKFEDIGLAITRAFKVSPKIIIEQFVEGKEATCGVVDNFRGQDSYSLTPIEILPPKQNGFYDYDAKYLSNDTEYILPGNFSEEVTKKIKDYSILAHRALGLRHYSRSDFMISPSGEVYILETNTLPGLTDHSLIPKSLAAVGCSLPIFLEHLITLALDGK